MREEFLTALEYREDSIGEWDAIEGVGAEGDGIRTGGRNIEGGEFRHAKEGSGTDGGDAFRERKGGDGCTVLEGAISNGGDASRERECLE